MGERYVDVGKVRSRSGALRAGARALRLSAPVRACPRPPAVSRRLRRLPSSRSVHFRVEIGSGCRPDARRVLLGLGR